jgi:hypothetical protein
MMPSITISIYNAILSHDELFAKRAPQPSLSGVKLSLHDSVLRQLIWVN